MEFRASEEDILGKNYLSEDQFLPAPLGVGGEHMRICLWGGSIWGDSAKGELKVFGNLPDTGKEEETSGKMPRLEPG